MGLSAPCPAPRQTRVQSSPHRPEGRSQNPARTRPSPGKIPPPSPTHYSDRLGPRLARLWAAAECPWVPSFPPCPCRPLGQGPSLWAVSGLPTQALAPGTACFLPLGLTATGTMPREPARLPVGQPPSHTLSPQCPALCPRGAGDQQRVLLKGRAEAPGETAVGSLGLQDPGRVYIPRAYRGAR